MKKAAFIFIIQIFVSSIAFAANSSEKRIYRLMSEDRGLIEEMAFYASLQKIYQLPSWDPYAEEPPISPKKAVNLAIRSLATNKKDNAKQINFRISEITLHPYYCRHKNKQKTLWFYIVTLYRTEVKNQGLDYIYTYVCVFLDGSTAAPEIKTRAKHTNSKKRTAGH